MTRSDCTLTSDETNLTQHAMLIGRVSWRLDPAVALGYNGSQSLCRAVLRATDGSSHLSRQDVGRQGRQHRA
jgi:hypothetical protein